jgi:hypothetical protein
MAAGCNKPASPIAEQTVERLRAPEDGPKREEWKPTATPECQAQAPVVSEERSLRGFVSRSVDANG